MTPTEVTIDEIVADDEPDAWRAAGFEVDRDDVCRVGTVRVRLAGRAMGKGLRSWSLRGLRPGVGGRPDIDGISTASSGQAPVEGAAHPNGVRTIDHLVLVSPDGERTARAITDLTGLQVRRTRDTGSPGAPVRQRFFRMGEVILELVSPRTATDGPARFFGLALTVVDLDTVTGWYGDDVSRPKEAVQAGRSIVTLRHANVDLSVAIAFMSPDRQGLGSAGHARPRLH